MAAHRLYLHRTQVQSRVAVSVTDETAGISYVVIPRRVDGRPRLAYLSMEPRGGVRTALADAGYLDSPESDPSVLEPPYLDHAYLATIALGYLDAHGDSGPVLFASRRRADWALRVQRPPDNVLLRVLSDAAASDVSMRRALHDIFGAELPTADDWIRHARTLPEGADLPRARRGPRPGKNANSPTKGKND